MTILRYPSLAFAAFVVTVVGGCRGDQDSAETNSMETPASTKSAPATDAVVSAGKITAPITLSYKVVGNPVVGQPVAVNLQIASTEDAQRITLRYRAGDASSMLFPEAQANVVELSPGMSEAQRMQQVTVVPQREGRLFLNVSAEVPTATGSMFKSLAIPIQVGGAQAEPVRNGELKETADGEQVISMPAEEEQ